MAEEYRSHHEKIYAKYKKMLMSDIDVLDQLVSYVKAKRDYGDCVRELNEMIKER